jgi:hypothetical protein
MTSAAPTLTLLLSALHSYYLWNSRSFATGTSNVRFQIIEYSEQVEMYLHRAQELLLFCEDKDRKALFFQTVEVAFGLQDKHHELQSFDFELGERLGRC